ncbi:hypothetical protein A8C56_02695 [Niabella ginsenosidivorans]|uniref:Uncharacterized protein n=1 Tax=Niabella ginsenosidivorans TaxID=1176587 RepID=A0A1A9I025_9BACT|nr:hypothetical protein [Niabella ginsenosidivorans]ANH80032.1 hypothetical protein A8C56_02695 [Niabella ginsenosidivorans]
MSTDSLLNKKFKGSSLLATLILSLIILITCGLMLLALYYFRFFSIRDAIDQRLADDLESGTTLVLANTAINRQPVHDSSLLFENNSPDSIYYTHELWGCFRAAGIKVSYKGRVKERAFLYSAAQFPYLDASVYLADHDRPLSVTGDTYIEGKAYLPKSGIRSGFFQEKGFSRKNLIEGSIDSSKKELPFLQPEYRSYFRELAVLANKKGGIHMPDNDQQSFLQEQKTILLPGNGTLTNQSFTGKLLLVSDSVIEVNSGARLNNVLLVAPFIHFNSGFKGSVQAIALDSITVESGCTFDYPSALVGAGRVNSIGNTSATVTIEPGSSLHGIILALVENNNTNIKPVVKIKSGATVKGMVYNEGYTYLNGAVEGAVFTDFFFEQRGPMSMENILIDATIKSSKWFRQAGYFSIFTGAARQTVIQWLD